MLLLRCLGSRLTQVHQKQRISETWEVFTLVRRWIFTGVKDLCMHLFSQGQPLLPLSRLFFVASLCFCSVALQLVSGHFPFRSASVPMPLISKQLSCTFNLQFFSCPHQIKAFAYQFHCHCLTSCNFLLSPLFLSLSLLFPQSLLPCTVF